MFTDALESRIQAVTATRVDAILNRATQPGVEEFAL